MKTDFVALKPKLGTLISVAWIKKQKQAQLSWDRLKEAQFSSVLTQISLAQKNQLREAQFSNLILIQISLAQKSKLRKAELFSLIFTQISFAQKSIESCHIPKSR